MEVKNFLILDIATVLAASKNREYREDVCKSYQALVSFLQINELTTRHLLDDGALPPNDFQIRRHDLTDQGFELVKKALDRWLDAIEAKNDPSDVSVLERALKKLRNS